MDKEKRESIGIAGQWLACALVASGIGIEVGMGADLGFVLITAGSIAFAISTKLRKSS